MRTSEPYGGMMRWLPIRLRDRVRAVHTQKALGRHTPALEKSLIMPSPVRPRPSLGAHFVLAVCGVSAAGLASAAGWNAAHAEPRAGGTPTNAAVVATSLPPGSRPCFLPSGKVSTPARATVTSACDDFELRGASVGTGPPDSLVARDAPCISVGAKPSSSWTSCPGSAPVLAPPPTGGCDLVPGKQPSSAGAICGNAEVTPATGSPPQAVGNPTANCPSGKPDTSGSPCRETAHQ
jgi:hypothetical protein